MLQWLARGTHEVPESGDVGAVRANAASIHREAEALSEIEIYARVIQLRETEPGSGLHAIQTGGIDRTGRAMALPGTARYLVKLLPIVFVPSVHRKIATSFFGCEQELQCSLCPRVAFLCSSCTRQSVQTVLLIYSRRKRAKKILLLVYQTRQRAKCLAHSGQLGAKCRNAEAWVTGPLRGEASESSFRRDSTRKARPWPEKFR